MVCDNTDGNIVLVFLAVFFTCIGANGIENLSYGVNLKEVVHALHNAGKTLKSTKAGDNINFNVGEKAFSLPIEGFSYGKFRDAAGIRPRLQVEKAPALYKDWNDILITAMNAPKNTQKAEAKEKMEVQYGLNKAGQLKPLPKDYDEEPPSRGFRR